MDDDVLPEADEHDDGLLDRLRDMPVGTLDPNIVGDAGPTDTPPGSDPPDTDEASLDEADPLSEP